MPLMKWEGLFHKLYLRPYNVRDQAAIASLTYALSETERAAIVKAVIYTATQCPHSKRLRKFLSEKGINVEERCVLTSPGLFDELYAVSKQRAIPVAVIDGEVFVGFDRRVERRIARKLGE